MKIIQLIQRPQRRGAEIFATQLSEALLRLGHQVLIVSIFSGDGGLAFSGKFKELNRSSTLRFLDLPGWKAFSKIIQSFSPDIIQANAADTLKFAVFSKKIYRWKVPIVYRNANQMGYFIRSRYHRSFNQFLINEVNAVASVSDASGVDFHNTFSFPEIASAIIPIGIDSTEIDTLVLEGLVEDLPKKFLIQIGGLVPEKDPLGMLELVENILREDEELHLIFLGSGPLESQLRAKIIQTGLSSFIHLIPNQPNIFPILKKARALVMPSKIEGFPGVILESMYCHIPVIAYGVGGIPEILTPTTGWCIQPNRPDDFLEGIQHILSISTNQLKNITDSAHELVTSQYSIAKISRDFEVFYQKLLGQ